MEKASFPSADTHRGVSTLLVLKGQEDVGKLGTSLAFLDVSDGTYSFKWLKKRLNIDI